MTLLSLEPVHAHLQYGSFETAFDEHANKDDRLISKYCELLESIVGELMMRQLGRRDGLQQIRRVAHRIANSDQRTSLDALELKILGVSPEASATVTETTAQVKADVSVLVANKALPVLQARKAQEAPAALPEPEQMPNAKKPEKVTPLPLQQTCRARRKIEEDGEKGTENQPAEKSAGSKIQKRSVDPVDGRSRQEAASRLSDLLGKLPNLRSMLLSRIEMHEAEQKKYDNQSDRDDALFAEMRAVLNRFIRVEFSGSKQFVPEDILEDQKLLGMMLSDLRKLGTLGDKLRVTHQIGWETIERIRELLELMK